MLTSREHIENLVSVRAEETLFRRAYITLFTHQLLHSFAFMKAMKWHPDKNPDKAEEAAKRFQDIGEAFLLHFLVPNAAPLAAMTFFLF